MPTRIAWHAAGRRNCAGGRTAAGGRPVCRSANVSPQQQEASEHACVDSRDVLAAGHSNTIDQQALTRELRLISTFKGVWEEVESASTGSSYTVKFQYYQTTPDHEYAVAPQTCLRQNHTENTLKPGEIQEDKEKITFDQIRSNQALNKLGSETKSTNWVKSNDEKSLSKLEGSSSKNRLKNDVLDKRRHILGRTRAIPRRKNQSHQEIFPNLSKCAEKFDKSCFYENQVETQSNRSWSNCSHAAISHAPDQREETLNQQRCPERFQQLHQPLYVSQSSQNNEINAQDLVSLENQEFHPNEVHQNRLNHLEQHEVSQINHQYIQELPVAVNQNCHQFVHRVNYDCQQNILSNDGTQDRSCLLPKNFTPVHLRSLEETEAAHDLLQLAQSAPAYPSAVGIPPCQTYDTTYDSAPTTPAPSPSGSSDAENVAPQDSIDDGRARIKSEINGSRYTCSECGKQYATSSNLSRHKQTHRTLDSGNARRCHVCGKAYVSMPALAMHVLTHNLNHKCGVCGKAFSRPWLLQGHMRSHTGEKPFGCAHCGKSFADRSNLRAHMQTHSQLKNFKCKRCNKSFALKSYLNKHHESACYRDGSCADTVDANI